MADLHPVSGDPLEIAALLRAWDAAPSPQPLVVETSGTTGRPKRVRLTRAAMRSSVDATDGYLGGRGQWVLALPAHHVAGVQVLYRSVRGGHDPVVLAGQAPQAWDDAVASMSGHRRYASLVPTQLVRLLDQDAVAPLAELDAVLVGGGPLDPARRREAEEAGVRVVMTYGMSETCGGCVYDGHPLDGVALKIADDGEIMLAGPMLFEGYDDGHGGIDEEGRLEVLGRRDQVVVSGGVNVPGAAVERMLAGVPGIHDVAVVGTHDPEWGEVVTAVVVTADGEAPDLSRLRSSVEPRAWAPRAVVVVDELPYTVSGKVDRAAVRALVARRS